MGNILYPTSFKSQFTPSLKVARVLSLLQTDHIVYIQELKCRGDGVAKRAVVVFVCCQMRCNHDIGLKGMVHVANQDIPASVDVSVQSLLHLRILSETLSLLFCCPARGNPLLCAVSLACWSDSNTLQDNVAQGLHLHICRPIFCTFNSIRSGILSSGYC